MYRTGEQNAHDNVLKPIDADVDPRTVRSDSSARLCRRVSPVDTPIMLLRRVGRYRTRRTTRCTGLLRVSVIESLPGTSGLRVGAGFSHGRARPPLAGQPRRTVRNAKSNHAYRRVIDILHLKPSNRFTPTSATQLSCEKPDGRPRKPDRIVFSVLRFRRPFSPHLHFGNNRPDLATF